MALRLTLTNSWLIGLVALIAYVAIAGCAAKSNGVTGDTSTGDVDDEDATGDVPTDTGGFDMPDITSDTTPPDTTTEELPAATSDICESCEEHVECGPLARCIGLTSGEFVCAATCVPDLPECPRGFDCIMNFFAGDITVCVPIGESCCIDEDADGYGQGIGCLGVDCDDEDIDINPGMDELCNTIDDDCDDITDEEVVDCGGYECVDVGDGTYEELEPGLCAGGAVCTEQPDTPCELYTCEGGTDSGDYCATECAPTSLDDDLLCIAAAHCDDGLCEEDYINGEVCDEDTDCVSTHCDNAFCCDAGTCCQVVEDCPGGTDVVTVCEDETTCQGTRGEGACELFSCTTVSGIPDDSACDATMEANECGYYVSIYCTGDPDQATPVCPTSCVDDPECDADAHCDSACVPDLVNGEICDEDSDCISAHCNNFICCDAGDCCLTPEDCPGIYSTDPICDSPTTCQGTVDVATCIGFECSTAEDEDDDSDCDATTLADDCGLYPSQFCSGGSDQPLPVCATSCTVDADCDLIAHCDLLSCTLDLPDGEGCDEDSDCISDHCQNGFCCSAGDCCALPSDCPGIYTLASSCNDQPTCQGTRVDAHCNSSFICEMGGAVDDDSGCTGGMESNACGPYPSIFCDGTAVQPIDQASLCPTTCVDDGDCDVGAHCNPTSHVCETDGGTGDPCDGTWECGSGLTCVDDVCCTSSCSGTCEACDLSGTEGTCTDVGSGDDPDGECLGFSCSTYFYGWLGDACYRRSDAPAADVGCDGDGLCETPADICPGQGLGAVQIDCDDLCQDADSLTCHTTTAGECDNVTPFPATQTCGVGACEVTENRCNAGTAVDCVPGSPTTETCNDIDDDCDYSIDEGLSGDAYESNPSCTTYRNLGTLYTMESGSYHTSTTIYPNLYGSGDVDVFRVALSENDTSCGCSFPSVDEDYAITADLTVPAGAGSYALCLQQGSCSTTSNCITVAAGSTGSSTVWKDGCCSPIPGTCEDSGTWYVTVKPQASPGFECRTYTLNLYTSQDCRS